MVKTSRFAPSLPHPSKQFSRVRATDLPGSGERDEESTRTRTGTSRRLHVVGIHAYWFGLIFAQCRTAYVNTHAALLLEDTLGSIPKGSHCNTSHLCCLGCTLQIMYHENTRLGESFSKKDKSNLVLQTTFSFSQTIHHFTPSHTTLPPASRARAQLVPCTAGVRHGAHQSPPAHASKRPPSCPLLQHPTTLHVCHRTLLSLCRVFELH